VIQYIDQNGGMFEHLR